MPKEKISEAFLAAAPKRNREWQESDDHAVILIPKFGNHFLGRLMLTKMKSPNFRLNLDEVGSFVWKLCDGATTVKDIGERLAAHFGETVDPVYDRLNLFFASLNKNKSITWV